MVGRSVLLSLALLAGCGDDVASVDAPAPDAPLRDAPPRDAPMLDAAPSDASPPDAALSDALPGVHVFQVDFGNQAADPPGNWVKLPFSLQNQTVAAIIDFASGQATPVSLTTGNWFSMGGAPQNWTAGDVDWLLAVVAQDAYGGFTMTASTVTFSNLDGSYRVEVVAATGFAFADQRIEVNGATTNLTHDGATGIDSASWNPQTNGTNAADWLIWPEVVPAGGAIIIRIQPGLVNAVRLSPPR